MHPWLFDSLLACAQIGQDPLRREWGCRPQWAGPSLITHLNQENPARSRLTSDTSEDECDCLSFRVVRPLLPPALDLILFSRSPALCSEECGSPSERLLPAPGVECSPRVRRPRGSHLRCALPRVPAWGFLLALWGRPDLRPRSSRPGGALGGSPRAAS